MKSRISNFIAFYAVPFFCVLGAVYSWFLVYLVFQDMRSKPVCKLPKLLCQKTQQQIPLPDEISVLLHVAPEVLNAVLGTFHGAI